MKKLLTITMAALLAAALLLTGCGNNGGEKTDIDLEATMKAMMDATEVEDEMKKMEGEVVGNFYDIDDSAVDSYLIYSSASGATAEEFAIFKAKDAKGVETIKTMLDKRVEDLGKRFEQYIPAEMAKVQNAVITENGNYVLFVCAGDPSTAEAAFDKAFQ